MKLRAIRIENVRRFVGPVEIAGIGDGLNILSTPNERGKSTMFDALHAVFFKDRKSWDKEIRSLVPHAGGDPSVAVEIELADGIYRIEKRWNSRRRGDARITTAGRLVKQADDAEAWIAEVLKSPKDGGPAGLLWVRQGLTGLDNGDTAHLARRDLLTSVAGEVEAMTGGRRMDAARDRCREELERYLTPKRRVKSDGPLKRKEDEVAALQANRVELAAKSEQLRDELKQRRDLRQELGRLEDPEEEAKRKSRLADAKAAHAEASRHAEALERAKSAEQAKDVEAKRAEERLASLEDDLSEFAKATEEYRTAKEQEAIANEQQRLADAAKSGAGTAYETALRHAESAAATLQQTLRAQAAAAATELRRDLMGQLDRAEKLRQHVEQATADARTELSDRVLADLETLDESVRILRRTRDLEAAAVTMAYTSGRTHGVSLGAETLPDGERRSIPDGARLEIEGIGQLTIHPGRRAHGETLATAEDELALALSAAGMDSIDDARASALRRRESEGLRRDAEAALQGIAPKGIDALRGQIAALPEPMDSGTISRPPKTRRKQTRRRERRLPTLARSTMTRGRHLDARRKPLRGLPRRLKVLRRGLLGRRRLLPESTTRKPREPAAGRRFPGFGSSLLGWRGNGKRSLRPHLIWTPWRLRSKGHARSLHAPRKIENVFGSISPNSIPRSRFRPARRWTKSWPMSMPVWKWRSARSMISNLRSLF